MQNVIERRDVEFVSESKLANLHIYTACTHNFEFTTL